MLLLSLHSYLQLLGESKVDELDVSGRVQKQVLRLEVPVDYPPGVQVVEGLDHARGVEAGGGVVKVAAIPGGKICKIVLSSLQKCRTLGWSRALLPGSSP